MERIEIVDVATWRHHHQEGRVEVRKIAPMGEGTKKRYPHGWGILARQFDEQRGYYDSHIVVILTDREIEITIPIASFSVPLKRFDFIEKEWLDRLIQESESKTTKEG